MRMRGDVPAGVLWLCALHLVLLVAHSLLVPTWLGPDEPNHADLVVSLREDWSYPAYDARHLDPGIRASLDLFEFRRHARHLTAAEAPPRDGRPTRGELADEGEDVDLGAMGRPGTRNHMSQHPPGYYGALAGMAEAVDLLTPGKGLGSVDRELGVLRWLSLLAAVPLPLVAWWVAREAGLAPGVGLAAAVVPLAVPQLTHIAAVVNSDGLLVLAFGVLTGLVLRIARGAVDTLTLVVAGLVTGGALFVKAFAFVIPVWVLAAFVVGRHRAAQPKHFAEPPPTGWRAWLPPLVACAGAAVAAGGWWWIANLVRYGDISPSIEYATRLSDPEPGFRPELGEWLGTWWPNMLQRYWGEFGWIDVALAGRLVVGASLCVAVGIVLAVARAVRSRRAHRRGTARRARVALRADAAGAASVVPSGLGLSALVLLLAPTLLLALFVGANGYRLYREAGFSAMVQGRYLFGGLVGLAVVVAAGWSSLAAWLAASGTWSRLTRSRPRGRLAGAGHGVALWFLAGAFVLQVVAMLSMLDFWWGRERASRGERLDALVAWSPWPEWLVRAVVVLVPAVAAMTLVALLRDSQAGATAGPGTGDGTGVAPAAGAEIDGGRAGDAGRRGTGRVDAGDGTGGPASGSSAASAILTRDEQGSGGP